MRETDLYAPVKSFLEAQGYEVKAEVGPVDVMACRGDEPPLIVELKTGFSLTLVHQVIERLAVSDSVYAAVPRGNGRAAYTALKRMKKLFRRLGAGLMTVRLKDGLVEVHCDPAPYVPRKQKRKTSALLNEFQRREGDPNIGGARGSVVTAYRQDAIRCAQHLADEGALKGALVAKATGVETATRMMRDNHYGWFQKVEKGVYDLSDAGRKAVADGMA